MCVRSLFCEVTIHISYIDVQCFRLFAVKSILLRINGDIVFGYNFIYLIVYKINFLMLRFVCHFLAYYFFSVQHAF